MFHNINLATEFSKITKHWSPVVVADIDNYQVKLAKGLGEFPWHSHTDEDELFYIFRGHLTIRMLDCEIELHEGDLFVVPKGVEHSPLAEEEACIVLLESSTTKQYGD